MLCVTAACSRVDDRTHNRRLVHKSLLDIFESSAIHVTSSNKVLRNVCRIKSTIGEREQSKRRILFGSQDSRHNLSTER
jgi:hypothetical protein